jgi:aspartate/methionine/tyrosine aminotransferase
MKMTALPHTPRLAAMAPSAIRELHNYYRELAHAEPDRDFIPLHFGEPDCGTPAFIVDAGCQALRDGAVFYEDNAGRADLKTALAAHLRSRWGCAVAPDEIVVTCGGVQAINLALTTLTAPGDTVINITPAWPNFRGAAEAAEARVVDFPLTYSDCTRRFSLDFDALAARIRSDRPSMIIVNSPSNPTGWVLDTPGVDALVALCRESGVRLLADEIYDRILFAPERTCPFRRAAGDWPGLALINGFSKSYCMTGWRVGYLLAAPALARQMARFQEFITSHAPSMAQVAAITALRDGEPFIAANINRYRELRDTVISAMAAVPAVECAVPDGGIYCFFRHPAAADSVAFCRRLAAETGVVLAPGAAFGAGGEGWLRLCFANEPARLLEAISRLAAFCDGPAHTNDSG